jgi:signal transduction histidine kinase
VERRYESIVANPLWLVVLVAIAIGLPVIALGEAAGNDARSRLSVAEANAAVLGVNSAAGAVASPLRSARDQILAVTQSPSSGKLPQLAAAIQAGDRTQMFLLLEALRSSLLLILPPSALADIVVLDTRSRVIATSTVGGRIMAGNTASSDDGSDRSDRPYARIPTAAEPFAITPTYRVSGGLVSSTAGDPYVALVARLADPVTKDAFGSLVVPIYAARLGAGLRAQVPAVDESYLLDDRGRLIVRASRPFTIDPNLFQDLRTERTVAAAFAGQISGRSVEDLFGRGPRLASSAVVPEVNWRLINLSFPTVASVELDSALAQQRFVRFGLVLLLLLASFLLSRSSRRTLRQRRALSDANVRIEQANAAKSQFLANMSHELRTPLNAIIGFADVLGQKMFGELNARQAEYVNDIVGSGRHLLALINDILDLAKVEAGRMVLESTPFSLREALGTGVTMVRDRASSHGIAMSLDVASDVDVITADERKVKQVVFNLLSNAVKFTPDGGQVAVTASRTTDEVQVAVRDTGVGIAAADQVALFNEFAQTDDGRRAAEGTGLGLTLAKRLVELHGGRIWVESQVGSGSTFTFALPLLVERSAS